MSARGTPIGVALALALCVGVMAGCATRDNAPPTRFASGELAFIDIDSFDADLADDLRDGLVEVNVRFPNQPATVNALPTRLQRWLSAVQRHGGGVTVRTADGYASKDVLGLVSMLVAGYKLFRDNVPAMLGRSYEAVIVLKDAGGEVEKIAFVKIDPDKTVVAQ